MLFKDQIEKREELEQAALQEAIDELASSAGMRSRHKRKQHSGANALN